MRRVSEKRQALMRKVKPIRDSLRAEAGRCEICGYAHGGLDLHEIARGPCRAICLDKRFALLVVCRRCHEDLGSAREWPQARQLAIIAERRLFDYDLKSYLELTSPRAPNRITLREVLEYMSDELLKLEEVAVRMRVNRRTVQNWVDAKLLSAIDVRPDGAARSMWRVKPEDLLHFVQSRKTGAEVAANARLITAAPELLERLQALVDLAEMDDEANDPSTDLYVELYAARFAISAATLSERKGDE